MFSIKKLSVCRFYDFEIETAPITETKSRSDRMPITTTPWNDITPNAITSPWATPEGPVDSVMRQAGYIKWLVDKWEASKGQKAWLDSYNSSPMAATQLHYYRQLQAEWSALTKGQEAYLQSFQQSPHAPSFIHHFAQIIADGEKLNDNQQRLLTTYQDSRKSEAPPPAPNW